ncbi:hypothetical protein Tco_0057780 [Tanacetum coccineum]
MRSTGIKRYIDPIFGCKIRRTNRKRIDKEGNVSRFQEYHTSDEEGEELSEHPPYNKYGFVDHPQLQREDQRNKFAPYSLPPQEGNMNGWLTEDANDSDLESTASNQPMSLTMEDTETWFKHKQSDNPPDVAEIIAQQLQNIIPNIVTQVTNNLNNANGNGNGGENNGFTYKALLTTEFCTSNEIEKLEGEFWNHSMVLQIMLEYTDQFHDCKVWFHICKLLRRSGHKSAEVLWLMAGEKGKIKRCLRFMGKRTNVNARSRRSTKLDESKLYDIPVYKERHRLRRPVSFVAYEDERVVGIIARAARAAEEREVSCEAQQGRSGVKRKFFGSCRNYMGNEPILALPEGSDNFIVMRGARDGGWSYLGVVIARPSTIWERANVVVDAWRKKRGVKPRRVSNKPEIPDWKWEKERLSMDSKSKLPRSNEAVARHGVHMSSIPDRDGMYIETDGQSEHTFWTLENMFRACVRNLVVIGILTFREAEIGESKMIGLELEQETTKFGVGDHVMMKVSPWKGVVRFGKKGELAPRYIGPIGILERIGPVAYRLRLPDELSIGNYLGGVKISSKPEIALFL